MSYYSASMRWDHTRLTSSKVVARNKCRSGTSGSRYAPGGWHWDSTSSIQLHIGPADQADLADFIARGNKPDLEALLRHAGERLPRGSDTTADHRVVLLQYLRRAPGHLVLALGGSGGGGSKRNYSHSPLNCTTCTFIGSTAVLFIVQARILQ